MSNHHENVYIRNLLLSMISRPNNTKVCKRNLHILMIWVNVCISDLSRRKKSYFNEKCDMYDGNLK